MIMISGIFTAMTCPTVKLHARARILVCALILMSPGLLLTGCTPSFKTAEFNSSTGYFEAPPAQSDGSSDEPAPLLATATTVQSDSLDIDSRRVLLVVPNEVEVNTAAPGHQFTLKSIQKLGYFEEVITVSELRQRVRQSNSSDTTSRAIEEDSNKSAPAQFGDDEADNNTSPRYSSIDNIKGGTKKKRSLAAHRKHVNADKQNRAVGMKEIQKLARNYRPFLWLRWEFNEIPDDNDNRSFLLLLADAVNGHEYFVTETIIPSGQGSMTKCAVSHGFVGYGSCKAARPRYYSQAPGYSEFFVPLFEANQYPMLNAFIDYIKQNSSEYGKGLDAPTGADPANPAMIEPAVDSATAGPSR